MSNDENNEIRLIAAAAILRLYEARDTVQLALLQMQVNASLDALQPTTSDQEAGE